MDLVLALLRIILQLLIFTFWQPAISIGRFNVNAIFYIKLDAEGIMSKSEISTYFAPDKPNPKSRVQAPPVGSKTEDFPNLDLNILKLNLHFLYNLSR